MKKMVVFGQYPDSEASKEGMMQRVLEIDRLLKDIVDIRYIDLSIKSHTKPETRTVFAEGRNIKLYKYNAILNMMGIYKSIKDCDIVYIHSVINYAMALPTILLSNKKVVLDIHGVVPEEFAWIGKRFRSIIYQLVEKFAFRNSQYFIAVTHQMIDFYLEKHKSTRADSYIFLPIFDSMQQSEATELEAITERGNTIVYAGGIQKWQNIETMIKVAKYLNKQYNFEFYTPQELTSHLSRQLGDDKENISLSSVGKRELEKIYRHCSLGFLLRDDILVNHVASPTKLNEYIKHGVVPILLQPNVGDMEYYGYKSILLHHLITSDTIEVGDLNALSEHNASIYRNMYQKDIEDGKKRLISIIKEIIHDN